jgi:hypothetical protein
MKTLNAAGRVYELYSFTGEVAGSDKNMSTRVFGGGYGNRGVAVNSVTTVHDDIFLIDAEGKEKSFQLSDFNVACREGHKLKVIWAIREGKDWGPYIVVVNQTTSRAYFQDGELQKMFRPNYLIFLLKSALIGGIILQVLPLFDGFAGFFVGVFLGIMIGVPVWKQTAINRAKKFQKNFKID